MSGRMGQPGSPPRCGCGCGEPVRMGRTGYRRFLNGHHGRLPEYQRGRSAALERARGTSQRNATIRARAAAGEKPADLAREYRVSAHRIQQILHPEKSRARLAVLRAERRGLITRPEACTRCGEAGAIEAHHADYARWLDVEWLCKRCHIVADSETRRESSPSPSPATVGGEG